MRSAGRKIIKGLAKIYDSVARNNRIITAVFEYDVFGKS